MKHYFDFIGRTLRTPDGAASAEAGSLPSQSLGEQQNFQLQLIKGSSITSKYTGFAAGTKARMLIDNDYVNPGVPIPLGAANWSNSSGDEYSIDLTAEPNKVYFDNAEKTRGAAGSLAAGAWDWAEGELYVRLDDDSAPATHPDEYISVLYINTSATDNIIEASSDVMNLPGTWQDDTTGQWRDPDITHGELTFNLSSEYLNYFLRIGTQESLTCFSEVQFFKPATGAYAGKIKFVFICENRLLSSGENALKLAGVDTYNKAVIDAKLAAAPVREYSVNGSTLWHSTQVTADRFYREIRLNGEPTAAFPLPLSAYQQWIDAGNTGTPTQFINSLKTINYIGPWVAGDYVLNDGVTHEGNLYVAQGSTNLEPPAAWTLFVSKGDAGYSAYALWIALGNTGTEEEFIASLNGTDATITIGAVETVDAGDPAEVENVGTPGAAVFNFKFPRGAKGADGANYSVTQQGTFAGRDAYDDENPPFSYLVIDTLSEHDRKVFWKLSSTSGDWSTGSPWTGPAGKAVAPRGAYNPVSTYLINDLVSHANGNSYVSRTDNNIGNDPATDATNWQLSATKGLDGLTGATGATPKYLANSFVNADLDDGILIITHPYGNLAALPYCITNGSRQAETFDSKNIVFSENQIEINLKAFGTITGTWHYSFGGCAAPSVVAYYRAIDLSQDWKDSAWPNISSRPALDYDQLNIPVWRIDYNIKEGLGIILTEPISLAATGLDFIITAQPHTPSAAGTNMAWKADVCRYRNGEAQTAIETITLGTAAFAESGVTQTSFQKTLSDMLAAEIMAGDQLAMIIYPDTAAADRKQTDWMVLSVTIKAV